jgi:hypothetical protein
MAKTHRCPATSTPSGSSPFRQSCSGCRSRPEAVVGDQPITAPASPLREPSHRSGEVAALGAIEQVTPSLLVLSRTSCLRPGGVKTVPHLGIAGAGHLFGFAAREQRSKRWEEAGKHRRRLLEADLCRIQLTIWPFASAVAIA